MGRRGGGREQGSGIRDQGWTVRWNRPAQGVDSDMNKILTEFIGTFFFALTIGCTAIPDAPAAAFVFKTLNPTDR
jgi:hypothetical protein